MRYIGRILEADEVINIVNKLNANAVVLDVKNPEGELSVAVTSKECSDQTIQKLKQIVETLR